MTLASSSFTHSKEVNTIVYTDTPRQGRTEEHPDGKSIQVIDHVDRDAFFHAFEELMRKAVCQIST